MIRLLVIADDYTGALDAGIQFAKRGISTTLSLYDSLTAESLSAIQAQVLVIDTESRHLPAHEAGRRVREVTQLARDNGFQYFFKKTDSTLRGNLGSELEAMQAVCGAAQLYFPPAYPVMGRTTVHGVQYINDIPLAHTEFAGDPFNPIAHSNIAALLFEQSGNRVRLAQPGQLLPCAEVPEIIVVDGQTDDDLLKTAQALYRAGRLTCFAGCAGFAAAVASTLPFDAVPNRWTPVPGGKLLVSGSIHPQSVRQCLYAVQHCGYLDHPLTLRQMLSEEDDCSAIVTSICKTLAMGGNALLRVAGGRELLPDAVSCAERLRLDEAALPARIAWKIGQVTQQILCGQLPGLMTVFGGDTLMGIAAALRCQNITPVAELLPGVVLSQMHGVCGCVNLVTKAGGFGAETLLRQIDETLPAPAPITV